MPRVHQKLHTKNRQNNSQQDLENIKTPWGTITAPVQTIHNTNWRHNRTQGTTENTTEIPHITNKGNVWTPRRNSTHTSANEITTCMTKNLLTKTSFSTQNSHRTYEDINNRQHNPRYTTWTATMLVHKKYKLHHVGKPEDELFKSKHVVLKTTYYCYYNHYNYIYIHIYIYNNKEIWLCKSPILLL